MFPRFYEGDDIFEWLIRLQDFVHAEVDRHAARSVSAVREALGTHEAQLGDAMDQLHCELEDITERYRALLLLVEQWRNAANAAPADIKRAASTSTGTGA